MLMHTYAHVYICSYIHVLIHTYATYTYMCRTILAEPFEEPSYTDPQFIMRGLELRNPKLGTDDKRFLKARRESAQIISKQILFYVYCMMHVSICMNTHTYIHTYIHT